MGEIVLIRHGQTEWSAKGRHTSYTDLPLTPEGERQAEAVGKSITERRFAVVLCSPRRRARDNSSTSVHPLRPTRGTRYTKATRRR